MGTAPPTPHHLLTSSHAKILNEIIEPTSRWGDSTMAYTKFDDIAAKKLVTTSMRSVTLEMVRFFILAAVIKLRPISYQLAQKQRADGNSVSRWLMFVEITRH
jgi:hypothetical protein